MSFVMNYFSGTSEVSKANLPSKEISSPGIIDRVKSAYNRFKVSLNENYCKEYVVNYFQLTENQTYKRGLVNVFVTPLRILRAVGAFFGFFQSSPIVQRAIVNASPPQQQNAAESQPNPNIPPSPAQDNGNNFLPFGPSLRPEIAASFPQQQHGSIAAPLSVATPAVEAPNNQLVPVVNRRHDSGITQVGEPSLAIDIFLEEGTNRAFVVITPEVQTPSQSQLEELVLGLFNAQKQQVTPYSDNSKNTLVFGNGSSVELEEEGALVSTERVENAHSGALVVVNREVQTSEQRQLMQLVLERLNSLDQRDTEQVQLSQSGVSRSIASRKMFSKRLLVNVPSYLNVFSNPSQARNSTSSVEVIEENSALNNLPPLEDDLPKDLPSLEDDDEFGSKNSHSGIARNLAAVYMAPYSPSVIPVRSGQPSQESDSTSFREDLLERPTAFSSMGVAIEPRQGRPSFRGTKGKTLYPQKLEGNNTASTQTIQSNFVINNSEASSMLVLALKALRSMPK